MDRWEKKAEGTPTIGTPREMERWRGGLTHPNPAEVLYQPWRQEMEIGVREDKQ